MAAACKELGQFYHRYVVWHCT